MTLNFSPNENEYLILNDDGTFKYGWKDTDIYATDRYFESQNHIICGAASPDFLFIKDGNKLISKRGIVLYPESESQTFKEISPSNVDKEFSELWDKLDVETYDRKMDDFDEMIKRRWKND